MKDTKSDMDHWDAIFYSIKTMIEENKDKIIDFDSTPFDIVILGRLGANPAFHQAIGEALRSFKPGDLLPPKIRESIVLDSVFVSAMGSARIAKAWIDSPKLRLCNIEDRECGRIREKVFQDSIWKSNVGKKDFREL